MPIVKERNRIALEKFMCAALDLIIEERGFDGEMLFLPQRDLRARDLLRDGRVPDVVLDRLMATIESAMHVAVWITTDDLTREAGGVRKTEGAEREAA